MTDGVAGALAAGAGQENQGDGNDLAGGGEKDGQAQAPAWMAALSDDLRADQDLARFGSLDDVAKGYLETRAWARGRVAIPGADDETAWKQFGERLRPEDASKYEIPVVEGADNALAEKYREFAFSQGTPPRWAKQTAEFFNQHMNDAMSQLVQRNNDGVNSIKLEMGPAAYAQRLEATNNMLRAAGFGDDYDAIKGLESAHGAEKTMRFLFSLSEKTGELGKVDPVDVNLGMGTMTPEMAKQEIDRAMGNKDFMAKAKQAGTPEAERWAKLNHAMAGGGAKR